MRPRTMLPKALTIAGPDGRVQTLLKAGASAPATARAVFATQRAGERSLAFKLYEEEKALLGTFTAELPPGLPPNTWLAVFVSVADDGTIRAAVKENLRRIDIEPVFAPPGTEPEPEPEPKPDPKSKSKSKAKAKARPKAKTFYRVANRTEGS